MRGLLWVSKVAVVGTFAVAACAVAATVAWATGTLDQSNPGPSTQTSDVCGARLAQTFTAGLTGSLDTVKLALSQTGASGDDAVVSILGTDSVTNPGSPDDGDVLATQAVPHIDSNLKDATIVFDNPASITAGTRYAIVLSAPTCPPVGPPEFYSWGMTTNYQFTGGSACVDYDGGGHWDCDSFTEPKIFVFATFVTMPPVPPSADVAVGVSGPSSAKKGTLVTYVVTVSNTGPDTAHNVVLAVPVPTGMSLQGVSTTKGSCAKPSRKNPAISCALGDLQAANDAHTTASLKITAKAGGNIAGVITANSTADGDSATPDPDTSNNSAALSTVVTK